MNKGTILYIKKLIKNNLIPVNGKVISFGGMKLFIVTVNHKFKDPDIDPARVINRVQVMNSNKNQYVGYINLGRDNFNSIRLPDCTYQRFIA